METSKQDIISSNNNESINNNNQQDAFWRRFGTKAIFYSSATALVDLYGVPAVFG